MVITSPIWARIGLLSQLLPLVIGSWIPTASYEIALKSAILSRLWFIVYQFYFTLDQQPLFRERSPFRVDRRQFSIEENGRNRTYEDANDGV